MSEGSNRAEELRRRVIEAQKNAEAAEVPTNREKLAAGAKKAKDTIKKCIDCYITDFQMA